MAKKKQTFEEGLEALEVIVRRMEEGSLPLEASLEAYEEGVKLHRQLLEQLLQSEQKMKTLRSNAQDPGEEEA